MFVVAHDRYLLSEVVDEIWELHPDRIDMHPYGFDEYVAQKKAQEALRNEASQEESTTPRQDSKARKREQAQLRNRIHQQLKPVREKFAALEARLETNLTEQEALETILADPQTYSDAEAAREAGQRFAALQHQAEDIMSELAYLEKEIQELEAQRTDVD